MENSPIDIPTLAGNYLANRTALITGGTSGIGLAIAKSFLLNGAAVVITEKTQEGVDRTVAELKAINADYTDKVWGCAIDNNEALSFKDKFAEILSAIGTRKIDILVNNAGIINGKCENEEDNFDLVMGINLKGAYFMSKVVGHYMIDNQIKGNILNLCSSSSQRPGASPYTISKWGMRSLTIGCAKTLIPHGIVVNGLAPGPTATPLLNKQDNSDLSLAGNPSGRYATAEEIANIAVVLTSGLGRMIVGDVIYVTGGAATVTVDDIGYGF